MMGAGKGAENGILFKGGEYLEIANKVTTILISFHALSLSTIFKASDNDIVVLAKLGYSVITKKVRQKGKYIISRVTETTNSLRYFLRMFLKPFDLDKPSSWDILRKNQRIS